MKIKLFNAATVLVLTLLFIQAGLAGSSAFQIDRIAAVVNGSIITASEVDKAFDAEVLRLEAEGKNLSPGLRKEVLDSLINRILILDEAKRFNLVQVSDEEVEKAFESVKHGFASESEFMNALNKEGMTVSELKENLKEQVLAAKYIDRRIKSFVRVTIDEQKKYFVQNRESFQGKSFDDVKEEINNLLVEKEAGRKMEEYLNDVRSKSDIEVMNVDKMRD